MAVFAYKALANMQTISGTIAAESPRQARALLSDRGLVVRDVAELQPKAQRRQWRVGSRSIRRYEATELIRELATLLAVGVPLLEALETLARQHRSAMAATIRLVHDRVAAGSSLAAALAEQPGVFDELVLSIVEVGESAGTLDVSLERLAEFRERADQLRGKLATSLIYPIIVSGVGLLCTLFLMTFVVPRILQPLLEQNLPLPWPTRIVKGFSDLLLQWWWLLALIAAALVGSFLAFASTSRGRRSIDSLVLRLPLIGPLAMKQSLMRIAVVLSTLLRSGIVLTRSMQIARKSARNVVISDAFATAEQQISAGGDLAATLESANLFPPLAVQVFSLGQQSGRLEDMLDRLAVSYELQVNVATQRLTALLEPAMIVVLAAFVLFIVLATVLPILEVGNAIG